MLPPLIEMPSIGNALSPADCRMTMSSALATAALMLGSLLSLSAIAVAMPSAAETESPVELVVTVAEGVPLHDAIRKHAEAGALVRERLAVLELQAFRQVVDRPAAVVVLHQHRS